MFDEVRNSWGSSRFQEFAGCVLLNLWAWGKPDKLSYFVQVIRLCISRFESRVTHLKSELRDLPFTPEEGSQGKGQGSVTKKAEGSVNSGPRDAGPVMPARFTVG